MRRISIHRPEYLPVLACLVEVRQRAGLTQTVLAARMKRTQGFISAVENRERRLDLLQTYEWCRACGVGLADLGEMVDAALLPAGARTAAAKKARLSPSKGKPRAPAGK